MLSVCVCVFECGIETDIMIRLQEVQVSLVWEWVRPCGLRAAVSVSLSRSESIEGISVSLSCIDRGVLFFDPRSSPINTHTCFSNAHPL